jgi:glucose-1-phosphate adenylyltransferase
LEDFHMSSAAAPLEAKTLAFVLAGGKGERLYPLTAHQPKPAVPFGGVFRIIDFTLSNLVNSGLRRIKVLTQYQQERLHSYVRNGRAQLSNEFRGEVGEHIMCLPPSSGKRYRGTADAVYQNLDVIEESNAEYILIVSGDQVYHMNYGELLDRHYTSRADLTMAAVHYPVERAASFGVIDTDAGGRAVAFEEKPASPRPSESRPDHALVNMGVYVFSREALIETLRQNVDLNGRDDFGRDIVPVLTRLGRAVVFPFDGYWRDLGTLDLYYQTNLDLLPAGAPLDPYENTSWPTHALGGTKSLQHSWLASHSRVSVDATLTDCNVWMSIVSEGVRIEAGAALEAAIALPGARIGKGARIRNAIVAENAVVAAHAHIGYDAEADRARFPVTENGVVIIDASQPKPADALRNARTPVQPARSIALVPPVRTPSGE